jgi:hypothetical protein
MAGITVQNPDFAYAHVQQEQIRTTIGTDASGEPEYRKK